MPHSHPAVTLSVVPPEILDQLKELSDATERTKLATQIWQATAIKKAIKKANNKKAKFIEHHKVTD